MQRRKATRNGSEGLKATSAEKAQTSASTHAWCRIGFAGTAGTFRSGAAGVDPGGSRLGRVRLRGGGWEFSRTQRRQAMAVLAFGAVWLRLAGIVVLYNYRLERLETASKPRGAGEPAFPGLSCVAAR